VYFLPAPILAATLWENLLWLLGYNDLRELPPDGKVQLELTNLPTSWVVFVLIAVILGLLYSIFALYRREMPGCPTWVKMVLATLRAAAMLLLVFILLNPALIYFRYRTDHPALIVARDASLSMNTRDSYQDTSAATSVGKLLGKSPEDVRKQKPTRVEIVNDALTQGAASQPKKTRVVRRRK